ncbi:unnamed protein product [Spirodela intermedia]|uniref:Tryptophan synthase beta chain-like PALP domain-containing protein n=1 Tax=Spirodela intermedia TaxID=51605 RepID=A0A7I8J7V6_SPIIN|nr:unnamed protein product [Spirodela intermedia]CAA6666130.1 unnamed protein product [Spirodela intermedia]
MRRRGIDTFASSPAEEGGDGERIAGGITQLIGWTPLLELKPIEQKDGVDARLVAKMETYQPLSSVKDRAALRGRRGEGSHRSGKTTLVPPTSGNLGIALACIAAQRGYKFIAVMPDRFSLERRIIMKSLGADVELTDSKLGRQGITEKVNQLRSSIPDVHALDQFSNPSNVDAHSMGTGPEIWEDTAGNVDIFVCASGSGGTISGAGRFLKSKNPCLKIVCVEPAESPVISGCSFGRRLAGRHGIQGIGPGFIPHNLDIALVDEVVTVSSEEAMAQARRLAAEEGLLVGISSGANLAACLERKMIVTIFASAGERYLSTGLFSQVREECLKMKP